MLNLRPPASGVALAVLLVLAAGCTSRQPETRRPPTATTPPPAAAAGERVLAVVTAQGGLELYGIGPQRAVARRIGVLKGPEGAEAAEVTMSGGRSPRVCATWARPGDMTLLCYEGGSTDGREVPTGGDELSGDVGISVSGRALAWTVDDPRDASKMLVVQRQPNGPLTRLAAYAKPDPEEVAQVVNGMAWSGEDHLLVSVSWDSDVNGSIASVNLDAAPRGWTTGPALGGTKEYPVIDSAVSSTTQGRVLAVLQGFTDEGPSTFQAAELRVSDGAIVSVVSVAAKGRRMVGVSGGPMGVVYRTESDTDVRTYWRAPGQARGTRVTGLPSDARVVVAQP